MDGIQLLANEIIRVAADDYMQIKCGRTIPGTNLNMIISFFHSDYYALLTNLDPDRLIKMLDDELEECGYNYRKILSERTRRRVLWEKTYYDKEKIIF